MAIFFWAECAKSHETESKLALILEQPYGISPNRWTMLIDSMFMVPTLIALSSAISPEIWMVKGQPNLLFSTI